ncbi:MAG: PhoH family protein [Planctomycetota bacterium]|nr:PhoH family protein [Planctomycetota bacterium]
MPPTTKTTGSAANASPIASPAIPGTNTAATSAAASNANGVSAPSKVPAMRPSKPGPDDTGIKEFVIDTNVVLHNPSALFVFQEHNLVIPFAVIEELDKMKRKDDDLGRNARECIRHLDRLRAAGRLTEGVNWGELGPIQGAGASTGVNGKTGTVRIDVDVDDKERPAALREDSPDNRIIAVAYRLHQRGKYPTVFVSKDLACRIKADALGIRTEDFENQKVDADRLYTGYLPATCEGELIDELYRDRLLTLERVQPLVAGKTPEGIEYQREILANQFIVMKNAQDENHTGLARRLGETEHVIPVSGPRKPVSGIMARNVQQTMALDLLLDDEIKLVTLLGSAGTGKTMLALAAGMTKVFSEGRYEKLLVARPIMPMGRDIGYLPGDKDEKLTAWMQPIFDNLSYLMSTKGVHMQAAESHSSEQRIQKLMADGKLVLEPLTYIRGRSIPHQFMIVDEAQNLTPHEVKTIASRVGEGTKLVLTGDIGQIDNPYLDSSSNGLSYTAEKMKGLGLFGHVVLARSERSELASLAASRL